MVISVHSDYIARLGDDISLDDEILSIRKKQIKAYGRHLAAKGLIYAPAYHFVDDDAVGASSAVMTAMDFIYKPGRFLAKDRDDVMDALGDALDSLGDILDGGQNDIELEPVDCDIHDFQALSDYAADCYFDEYDGDDDDGIDFDSALNPLRLPDDMEWLQAEYGIVFNPEEFMGEDNPMPSDPMEMHGYMQELLDDITAAYEDELRDKLEGFLANAGLMMIDGAFTCGLDHGNHEIRMRRVDFIAIPEGMEEGPAELLAMSAFRNLRDAAADGDTAVITGVRLHKSKIRPLSPRRFFSDLDKLRHSMVSKGNAMPAGFGDEDDEDCVVVIAAVVECEAGYIDAGDLDSLESRLEGAMNHIAMSSDAYEGLSREATDIVALSADIMQADADGTLFSVTGAFASPRAYGRKLGHSLVSAIFSYGLESEIGPEADITVTDAYSDDSAALLKELGKLLEERLDACDR